MILSINAAERSDNYASPATAQRIYAVAIMSSAEMRAIAAELYPGERLIFQIAELRRGLASKTARRAEEQLQQAVIDWYLALIDLADAGDTSAIVVMREPNQSKPDDGEHLHRAQLRAITVLVTGDRLLDALAWAELERRGKWPTHIRADHVPSPWPVLARYLSTDDPLHPDFAYLDLTWCEARDVLIAHPDPRVYSLPGYSGDGDVTLQVAAIDERRERAALIMLQRVQRALPWPGRLPEAYLHGIPSERAAVRYQYEVMLDHTLALPALLSREQRECVNRAQQIAGFAAPPIAQMARRIVSILRRHVELRPASSGFADSPC